MPARAELEKVAARAMARQLPRWIPYSERLRLAHEVVDGFPYGWLKRHFARWL